jgi:hypothetical protein
MFLHHPDHHHLRWRAAPRLLVLALVAALPTLLVWVAAIGQSVGLGRPLDLLPIPAAAPTRLDRLLLLGTVWLLTLGCPLAAFVLGVLGLVDAELHIAAWEITVRVRLPAPPWSWLSLLALLLIGVSAALFAAMAGHLAADCLLGGDCGLP